MTDKEKTASAIRIDGDDRDWVAIPTDENVSIEVNSNGFDAPSVYYVPNLGKDTDIVCIGTARKDGEGKWIINK